MSLHYVSAEFRQLLNEEVRRHEPLLKAYLRRRLRRHEDVEDFLQEVYTRVLATPPRNSILNWQGFFRRIAANLMIDRARRAQTRQIPNHSNLDEHPEQIDERPTAEETFVARERLDAVAEVLKELPPVGRAVFLLVRIEGLSYSDAAQRLGIDVKAAYRHVEQALLLISRRLAEDL